MHIPSGELLFGVAPAILVDCAKHLKDRDTPFSEEDFCIALGAPFREAEPVLLELERAGFVLRSERAGCFTGTSKLGQLALASVGKGLTREQADELLAKVIQAARKVNAEPTTYPYGVSCVAVFGSYLSDKPILGDLDVGVALGPDRTPYPRSTRWQEAVRFDASNQNKTFAALRLRKPKLISVHEMKEVQALGTPFKVLLGVWPLASPSMAQDPGQACELPIDAPE